MSTSLNYFPIHANNKCCSDHRKHSVCPDAYILLGRGRISREGEKRREGEKGKGRRGGEGKESKGEGKIEKGRGREKGKGKGKKAEFDNSKHT